LPNDGVIRHMAIRMQSMIPKLMGPVNERWFALLKNAFDVGFNAIHLTPVQELGISNSAYCLLDQLSVSSAMFPNLPNVSEKSSKTVCCI
jgi:hypothetical protein